MDAEEPGNLFYLNIFNLSPEVVDKDIISFYKGITISNIFRQFKDAADLEFLSKDMLIKAIDFGTGNFNGQSFYIRSSYYNSRKSRRGGMRGSRGGGSRYGRGGAR